MLILISSPIAPTPTDVPSAFSTTLPTPTEQCALTVLPKPVILIAKAKLIQAALACQPIVASIPTPAALIAPDPAASKVAVATMAPVVAGDSPSASVPVVAVAGGDSSPAAVVAADPVAAVVDPAATPASDAASAA